MAKGTTFSNDVLKKMFNSTAFSWEAISNVYIALHTASPTTQSSTEITYTGYARVALSRIGAGDWTVTGTSATNANTIAFPIINTGSPVASYVSVGTAATGAGEVLWSGILAGAPITFGIGATPKIAAGNLVVTES
jgi:hypothetical protein